MAKTKEKKADDKPKKKINSKQKGKRGELSVAHEFQKYGFDARRSQQYAGINSDADVVGVPYLHLEVKRTEKLRLDAAMEQSQRDSKEDEIPVVVHRKDRQDWRITMKLEEFMPIYMAWLKQKGQNNAEGSEVEL